MLNAPALKKRLAQAMKERPEVKQARIAEATKKTPQAVSAWVKTGQIDPTHFPALSQLFGKPLEYWYGTESATVHSLPSQPAGRGDLTVRFARAAADKVAARMGIERSSDDYLVVFDEIHRSIKEALENEVPDNRLDLAGRLSPITRGDEDNADRRETAANGDHPGGTHRGKAGKPPARRKPR